MAFLAVSKTFIFFWLKEMLFIIIIFFVKTFRKVLKGMLLV